MYKTILIPLENSATDQVILDHVRPLARLCSSKLLLVHIADGFVARNKERLNLSESEEILADRLYLDQKSQELIAEGFQVSTLLGFGEPAPELLTIANNEKCDLIAMATHGHGLIGDLILGSVAEHLRHRTDIPILMLRSQKKT
jgi:nucleotide-binding universal stress UspA family protein